MIQLELFDPPELSRPDIWRHRMLIDNKLMTLRGVMMDDANAVAARQHKILRDACEKIGHQRGKFHDNGIGWTWWYCNTCGASFDKQNYFD